MEPFVDIGVRVFDMLVLLCISLYVEVITLNANRWTDSWNFHGLVLTFQFS